MQLQKNMINGKIIFDRSTGKFMTKRQMIKLAEGFWEQGLREDEVVEIVEPLKKECSEWGDDFNKEYLRMKIDYLLTQFSELQQNSRTGKLITPFEVWDATDEETWELVEIPQQIFGIWIDDDGEDKIKRIKELIQWNKNQ